jgi:hypothetical protein
VEGNTAGIEDVITVVASGGSIGVVKGIAESGAAGVTHEPAAVAVAAEAAAFVCELATAKAAGVGLKVDGDSVEGVASWVVHKIVKDTKTVTCECRKRTIVVAVVTIFTHCSAFVLVVEPVANGVKCAVAVTGIAIGAVGTEAVIACAMFAIVGAVIDAA